MTWSYVGYAPISQSNFLFIFFLQTKEVAFGPYFFKKLITTKIIRFFFFLNYIYRQKKENCDRNKIKNHVFKCYIFCYLGGRRVANDERRTFGQPSSSPPFPPAMPVITQLLKLTWLNLKSLCVVSGDLIQC